MGRALGWWALLLMLTGASGLAYDTRVRVRSRCSARVAPTAPAAPSLTDYMRLPTAQYELLPLPFGASLTRADRARDDGRFLLAVPELQFFWVRVAPRVEATVETGAARVVVASDRCRLEGRDRLVAAINDAFRFDVTATMTWVDGGAGPDARRIDCDARLNVDVAPPGPFRAMPRALLESTGNAVMRVATDRILGGFLRALAADYAAWASDPAYRARRAAALAAES